VSSSIVGEGIVVGPTLPTPEHGVRRVHPLGHVKVLVAHVIAFRFGPAGGCGTG
jgi:hypothetical protein